MSDAAARDDRFVEPACAGNRQRQRLERLHEIQPHRFRKLADRQGSVDPRQLQHNLQQPRGQERMQRGLDLLARALLQVPQDACVKLFARERRLEIDE